MNREHILARLRTLEPELKAAGVVSVSVFGSVARGDFRPDSDVDVAVRLTDNFSGRGLDYFWRLDQLQQKLSHLLGCKVDVVTEPVQKAGLKAEIDRDRALAF